MCCGCGADMGVDPRDFPPLPDGTMPTVTHDLCPRCVEKAEREYGLEKNPLLKIPDRDAIAGRRVAGAVDHGESAELAHKPMDGGIKDADGAPCFGRAHRAGAASPAILEPA
jgi:hypothetical protein